MADLQVSPISQLLHTLGLTREDLNKRSDQMRQFLTADDALSSRVLERDSGHRPRSRSELSNTSRPVGSSRSLARSLSRASSSSLREGTPPATPVKSEPHESTIPHRRMDSMEMVLERQRRQRKSRKERERESSKIILHQPSPSPSNASQSTPSLDSHMHSRDESRNSSQAAAAGGSSVPRETVEPPPVTPQKSKYYRDHTNLSVTSQPSKTQPLHPYYAYPGYMGYPHYLPVAYRPAQASSSSPIPITPQAQRTQSVPRKKISSPLPPSSPPPPSSPMSSPVRRIVNVVSSPGPMGPEPEENEYDNLPYKLPPGPYSPNKPDLSYAALVGRAILSSPEHRLTLQEIYDWITIVYPYYKRGETTWMNSIRHVLSTTVCFRKVPRDRSVGRTLWAIYDEDLECFKDGGFKKHLCKDYINGNDGKEKGASKGKARARKRGEDDDNPDSRKTKKAKKDQAASSSTADTNVVQNSLRGHGPVSSHLLFPPTRPTPHHQPYYESCVAQPQTFPAELIFPPLPPSAAFNRVVNNSSGSFVGPTKPDGQPATAQISPPSTQGGNSPAPPTLSSASSSFSSASSVPELTPNRNSSSSPPSSLPATSDVDTDMHDSRPASSGGDIYKTLSSAIIADPLDDQEEASVSADGEDDGIFNTMLLGPVRFWGESPKTAGGLQPGIELLNFSESDDDNDSVEDKKGKKKQGVRNRKNSSFPPVPTSPTLACRTKQSKASGTGRPTTPVSSLPLPSTPPRSTHQISSVRTPISHKGLHMSPSTSLAHYKSNLDPPPVYTGGITPTPLDFMQGDDDADPMRTPRKSGSSTMTIFGNPVTPRKLMFGMTDSPFRTPSGQSPFRTPGSRHIFDPHDPRRLLDEELNRMNNDSPGGLFGNARGSLLYDSPGLDTDSHPKWW
ncbi:hypothetical protein NLJ89_g1702 [Agrocybe chaxingu]|uniref:Fork-head domain-containing protein n=1 Tax=Agrocybe chaxingu TaxID=84603 RepID=A0A9W8MZK1_9AGAR|nr:hypothetical protein NLJ89_g1702 [Agrocybe chaxingu]